MLAEIFCNYRPDFQREERVNTLEEERLKSKELLRATQSVLTSRSGSTSREQGRTQWADFSSGSGSCAEQGAQLLCTRAAQVQGQL